VFLDNFGLLIATQPMKLCIFVGLATPTQPTLTAPAENEAFIFS
jgi:hypothetical protein